MAPTKSTDLASSSIPSWNRSGLTVRKAVSPQTHKPARPQAHEPHNHPNPQNENPKLENKNTFESVAITGLNRVLILEHFKICRKTLYCRTLYFFGNIDGYIDVADNPYVAVLLFGLGIQKANGDTSPKQSSGPLNGHPWTVSTA